ncbi:MAG: DoxX family protein [Chitinophagaceae bacterium]|nr:DoxX family protein [Chitinophagaceae bacterium]
MNTKTTNILYWVFTLLFAGLMIFSAVPNIMSNQQSIDVFHGFLGYPKYFIPLIGWAKLIGSVTILIPGLNKLKEWAYAGLFFDLFGATYSGIAVSQGNIDPRMAGMLLWIIPGVLSYIFWTKKMKADLIK